MFRSLVRIIILCFFSLSCFAQVEWVESDEVPEGFESFDQPESTVADVYYGDLLISHADIEYTSETLHINQVNQLIKQLPDIKNPEAVVKALSGKIPTHSELLCKYKKQQPCDVVFPEIAGVIFDPETFRLTLFIHGDYLKENKRTKSLKYIKNSSSDLAYTHFQSSSLSGGQDDLVYSSFGRGVLSHKNKQLVMRYVVDGQSESNNGGLFNLSIEEVAARILNKRHALQFGMINSFGSDFLTQESILGVSYSTSDLLLYNQSELYGSPVLIFLSLPSQVQIFKDDRLYSTQYLGTGNQELDTSRLPAGSYDITIKIQDTAGNTREETQFFTKIAQLPAFGFPDYYYSIGLRQKDRSSDGLLMSYTSTPIVNMGRRVRVSNFLGMDMAFLSDFQKLYGVLGTTLMQKGVSIRPALLISSASDYGFSVNARWTMFDILRYASTFRKIFAQGEREQNQFDPVTSNVFQWTHTLGWKVKQFNFNASYQQSSSDGDSRESLGLSISRGFELSGALRANTTFQYTKSSEDQIVELGVNLTWIASPLVNHTANLGYRQSQQDSSNNKGLSAKFSTNWRSSDAKYDQTRVQANLVSLPSENSLDVNIKHDSGRNRVDGNFAYSIPKERDPTYVYGINYDTSFVLSNNGLDILHPDAQQAAVIINVKGPNDNEPVSVYNGTSLIGTVQTNQSKAVYVRPFTTYKLYIQPDSDTLYSFDQKPREVTLYEGNIKVMKWDLKQKIVIIGTFVGMNGEIIKDAIVEGGEGVNEIDETGYVQLEVDTQTKHLIIVQNQGKECQVNLPPLETAELFMEIGSLACEPVAKKTGN